MGRGYPQIISYNSIFSAHFALRNAYFSTAFGLNFPPGGGSQIEASHGGLDPWQRNDDNEKTPQTRPNFQQKHGAPSRVPSFVGTGSRKVHRKITQQRERFGEFLMMMMMMMMAPPKKGQKPLDFESIVNIFIFQGGNHGSMK